MTINQYDTLRAIRQQLKVGTAAIDLTGCTVTLLWKPQSPNGVVRQLAATIVDAATGIVEYQPLDADVATPGLFDLQWKVVSPGGRLTVPTNARTRLAIAATLA